MIISHIAIDSMFNVWLFILRWFNNFKLSSWWYTNTRNFMVQRCKSRWSLSNCWNLQWWNRITDIQHSWWGYWRIHMHCTQWWGTGLPYGQCYYSGWRCYHGKNAIYFIPQNKTHTHTYQSVTETKINLHLLGLLYFL